MKISALIVAMLLLSAISLADIKIDYQGCITDSNGDPVADGDHSIIFRIYDAETDGSLRWEDGPMMVSTKNGLFSAEFGPFLANLFADDTACWLGISIGGDSEIDPRTQLTSMAYSYHALSADHADSADVASHAVFAETAQAVVGGLKSPTIDYPDGLEGITYCLESIYIGIPYTVPSGKNLYVTHIDYIGADYMDYLAVDGLVFLHGDTSISVNLCMPWIFGAGTVLSADGTPPYMSVTVTGFLVDATVTVINATSYEVPAGKIFVLTNACNTTLEGVEFNWSTVLVGSNDLGDVHQPVLLPGPGMVYTDDGLFNGYLMDE